jgi:hypothetical protein
MTRILRRANQRLHPTPLRGAGESRVVSLTTDNLYWFSGKWNFWVQK